MKFLILLLFISLISCSSNSFVKTRKIASQNKFFATNTEIFVIEKPLDECLLAKIKETFTIGQNQTLFNFDPKTNKVIPAPGTVTRVLEFYAVILDDGSLPTQRINPTKQLEKAKETLRILSQEGLCKHPQVYTKNDYSEYEAMLLDLVN